MPKVLRGDGAVRFTVVRANACPGTHQLPYQRKCHNVSWQVFRKGNHGFSKPRGTFLQIVDSSIIMTFLLGVTHLLRHRNPLRISGFKFQVLNFGFRISDFDLRISSFHRDHLHPMIPRIQHINCSPAVAHERPRVGELSLLAAFDAKTAQRAAVAGELLNSVIAELANV